MNCLFVGYLSLNYLIEFWTSWKVWQNWSMNSLSVMQQGLAINKLLLGRFHCVFARHCATVDLFCNICFSVWWLHWIDFGWRFSLAEASSRILYIDDLFISRKAKLFILILFVASIWTPFYCFYHERYSKLTVIKSLSANRAKIAWIAHI